MIKKYIFASFFLFNLMSVAFASSGVLLKNTKVNDYTVKKGEAVEIISESSTGYKVRYKTLVFLTDKNLVLKTLEEIKSSSGEKTTKEVATQAYLKKTITLTVNKKKTTIEKGSKVVIIDYDGTKFKSKDVNGIIFYLDEDIISFSPIQVNPDYNTKETFQDKQKKLIEEGVKRLGIPYLWGGTSQRGYDCSGFTQALYSTIGIAIPKYSQSQAKTGIMVSKDSMKIGDLIFFDSDGGSNINHVAMYIGDGKMIHSASTPGCVVIDEIATSNLFKKYVVVIKRILDKDYLESQK